MRLKVSRNHLFYLSCYLFVFSLPLPISFNNVAIAIFLAAWLLHNSFKEKRENLNANKHAIWIVILFVAYSISLLYSSNVSEGLTRLETKFSLVAISLIVLSSSIRRREISLVLRFFTYSNIAIGLGLFLMACIRYWKNGNVSVFFYHEFTSPIELHAIYFAIYLCLGVFILIFDSTLAINLWTKIVLIAISLWLIVMLSALMVIGFLILATALGVLLFVTYRTNILRAAIIASSLLIFLLALVFLVPRTQEKLAQIKRLDYNMDDPDYAWNTITLRLAMWKCALPVTLDQPFFGVGVGDENDALQKSYTKYNFKEGIRCNYNTHNQYLSTYIAVGFVGLAILLITIFVPATKAFKQGDWLVFMFLSLITFSFLTENILSVQKGVVFFSFFYALLLKKNAMLSVNNS